MTQRLSGDLPGEREEAMGREGGALEMNGLVIERIDTVDKVFALRSEWQSLAHAQGCGFPFQTWEWLSLWWTHFAEHGARVRDSLFVRAFRSPSGELVGVAPMMLTRRPGIGPLGIRVLDFFGTDPYVTEHRGTICHPEWEGRVTQALLQHLQEHAADWDWIQWRGLREGSEALGMLTAQPGVTPESETANYLLRLSGNWESFRSSRPRNIKESLRKCYNSLKRDGHTFALEVAATPAEVRVALERFIELHGARADLGGTIAHGNVFASPNARAFLFDVCHRLAVRNMVRIFQLRIAGRIVASRVGFALGDALYLYFSGYDPEWGRYSVMTTTVAEAIRYALAQRFASVNLSFGTDVSKTRWDPEKLVYHSALQVSPLWSGRLAHFAYRRLADRILAGAAGKTLRRLLGRKSNLSAMPVE